ncbi:MAG: Ppx/GppA phosphatase [Alphaproteobacteria bacterium]|nr:Ppx/GppA phosphatase [Alphaproteobacteria bacterium]
MNSASPVSRGHRRPRGRWRHVYAALDLGTNNCRLLVARPTRNGFRVVDAFSRIVRLGEGVSASGRLSDEAISRTIAALKVCAGKMRRRRVTRSRSIATEACRRADNCDEFLRRVREEVGIDLDIISPAEEAELALAGCSPLLDNRCRRALVFDIGGGSTELMWIGLSNGRKPDVLGWTSLPCGVVTLSEKFGDCGGDEAGYTRLVRYVSDLLSPFAADHGMQSAIEDGDVHMLGTSGTVTTLAAVHLGLTCYDRSRVDGTWLSIGELDSVTRAVSAMPYDQRASHACIRQSRADLVIAGCAIVEAISRAWPAQRLRVADRGLREGLLLGLMQAADAEARP